MKLIEHLQQSLFWDVDIKEIDPDEDSRFIIGRVLDFGDIDDFKAIENYYGKDKIKESAKKHVFANPESANFWALILSIPSKQLKCTRKPSLKTPNAFLKR